MAVLKTLQMEKRKKKDIEGIKLRDRMFQNLFTADDFIDHHW